jgi:hypothetical protein
MKGLGKNRRNVSHHSRLLDRDSKLDIQRDEAGQDIPEVYALHASLIRATRPAQINIPNYTTRIITGELYRL